NAMIEHNQTLIIDTNPRNKRVEIRSENESRKVMGFFDHGGDFWKLIPGENEIRYRADQGIAEAVATVSWQNQYVRIKEVYFIEVDVMSSKPCNIPLHIVK